MHDPLLNHDEISKVQSCPCNVAPEEHHHHDHHDHEEEPHAHGRTRSQHEHTHDHSHGEHVHDGRPHVHLPDGTVRYLEEGELPSAPKRRRSPTEAKS